MRRVTFNASGYILSDIRALGRPEQQTTTYTRQADTNLLLAMTDALGRRTEYTYDALGNKTSVEKLDARSSRSVTVFLHEAFGQTRFAQGTPAESRLP